MAIRDQPSFLRMFQAFPVRTGLFTLGPLAVGLAQVCNAVFHGSTLWPVVAVAAAMVVFSLLVTSYHLASFRRRTLVGELD